MSWGLRNRLDRVLPGLPNGTGSVMFAIDHGYFMGPTSRLEYQSIAMSTDYDCWHESEAEVSMEIIFAVMEKNVQNVKKLIEHVIPIINRKYK